MFLIVGGRFQGKTEFARSLAEKQIITESPKILNCREIPDGQPAELSLRQMVQADVVACYEVFLRKILKEQKDAAGLTEELVHGNPEVILTMTELGCGVVPVEAADTAWRETSGRISCDLAAKAAGVWRMVCGLPQRLK
jgi:adenosylcobinamide kinase/adenosylcobinamide-phosphate guanylyltransferase